MTPAEQLRATMRLLESIAETAPAPSGVDIGQLQTLSAQLAAMDLSELTGVDEGIGDRVKQGLGAATLAGAMALGGGAASAADAPDPFVQCAAINKAVSSISKSMKSSGGLPDKLTGSTAAAGEMWAKMARASGGIGFMVDRKIAADAEKYEGIMRSNPGKISQGLDHCDRVAKSIGGLK